LRISADPSSRMRKIGFIVVLLRGCLSFRALFLPGGATGSHSAPPDTRPDPRLTIAIRINDLVMNY
ncbi:hypothetical protein, partial [Candidatus Allofournierella merdavium]|uniref:hypothetical protein n=1 Tax=Candidatus Allofournierella merdavium TaxID=2838593 RepID=UPI00374EF05E